jgi:spoIIIJ-associated protein
MKDQVFTAPTVDEAIALAELTLGVSRAHLQYVVLEKERPGTLGRADSPARIAILLEGGPVAPPGPQRPAPAPAPRRKEEPATPRPVAAAGVPRDYRASVREVLRAIAEAADVDLSAELREREGAVTIVLEGEGRRILLEDEAEPLRALEQILQRVLARDGGPRRLVLECEGYRDARGEALRSEALRLADAVCGDGRARTTDPLNSYERRLVHVALAEHPRVKTFSVGEGADRRVTVALRERTQDGAPEA